MNRLDTRTISHAPLRSRRRLAKWLKLNCPCVECIARAMDRMAVNGERKAG